MKSVKNNITIRYAADADRPQLYQLWQDCFHDSDAFTDYYFDTYFKENKVLLLEEYHHLKAMLHLNPYPFIVNGKNVDSYYIVGVATDVNYRHRGAMTKLLQKTFQDCYNGHMPFVYLMPADEAIYLPTQFAYIYAQRVERKSASDGNHWLPSKVSNLSVIFARTDSDFSLAAKTANQYMAMHYQVYTERDAHYFQRLQMENQVDGGDLLLFYVDEKYVGYISFAKEEVAEVREIYVDAQYQDSIENWALDYFDGVKTEFLPLSTDGFFKTALVEKQTRPIIMGRIIDLDAWIHLLPVSDEDFSICMQIRDDWIEDNNAIWRWCCSEGQMSFEKTSAAPDIEIGIDALMQWQTAYRTLDALMEANCMTIYTNCQKELDKIPVLHGIIINEIV